MDQQATTLLAALRRTSASAESKLTALNTLKSDIKHYRVPDNAQATIFECLKLAISQQTSTNITTAAFSTLGHLVKRLKIQDAEGAAIAAYAPSLWPALQERLGDHRESNRACASQAFGDFWPYCAPEVERIMRDEAIGGTHARAKETGMEWVVKMNQDASLAFKSFVPPMVACLEDADGSVRDTAKSTLVELFRPAPDRAKADLKKQLSLHNVRSSIADPILSQIGISAHAPARAQEADLAASTRSLPALDHLSQFAESLNSEDAKPPPQEEVPMDPIFVHSHREVEDIFRDMNPHFEGKETEENWLLRDKDILKLRRLTKGNAPSDYHTAYMTGLKHLQDGTLKAANTLRTTMATNGCLLVQELAKTLGPAMDSMVEIYLQSFIKMCAATKHIAAQHGAQTTDTILQYVSYNRNLMQHVWAAATDKNKQPRQYAAGWLRTLLNKQAGSKTHYESSGGLELAEKTINKGLHDADPKVKESMRATYWTFARIWPDRAATIMQSLDTKAKAALEKDSHNPNASQAPSKPDFAASTSSRASGARSALRERIAAARNANKTQPSRPNTAMASMTPAKSPARSQSRANVSNRAQALAPPPAPTSRVVSNASTTSNASTSSSATTRPNSLMSGAARRPVRRPEIARPATADPHASRNIVRPETPSNQDAQGAVDSPRQSTLTKATAASNAKNRAGRTASPAVSPVKGVPNSKQQSSKDNATKNGEESNAGHSDDSAMVPPPRSHENLLFTSEQKRPTIDKTMSVDSGLSSLARDDDFTMVMPNLHESNGVQRERSPLAHQSAVRSISEEASGIPLPSSSRSSTHGRSPKNRSPTTQRESGHTQSPAPEMPSNGYSRQGSPLKNFSVPAAQQMEDVQVFEDPFTAETPVQQNGTKSSSQPVRVLNELPLNEANTDPALGHSPAGSNTSTSPHNGEAGSQSNSAHANGAASPPQSPQTKAETLRSRKLLQSGIERIKARTLDTHGFRKVLDLTRNNEPLDLFASHTTESKRFDELMSALCAYVNAASESLNSSTAQSQSNELKRQAFALLRALLTNQNPVYRKWTLAGSWPSHCLSAALSARRTLDTLGLVIKDLEALVTETTHLALASTLIPTIILFLDRSADETSDHAHQPHNDERSPDPARTTASAVALALRTLTSVLTADLTPPDESQRTALVKIVARHLRSRDAEVRKADVGLATALYAAWPPAVGEQQQVASLNEKSGFWNALERTPMGLQESTKNLIVYFIARGEGRVEVR